MSEPRRALVTGGAGFIGSFLCEQLLERGHEVVCLDNYFTGSRNNILHLRDHPRFEAMRYDITQPLVVQVDDIYNLACPASPKAYQFDPVKTVQTNVQGTLNMLESARAVEARFFQASTSEVYGDPDVHPQTEDYVGRVNPIGPRACYDEGKRCAETLCTDYRMIYHMDIKIARIFNCYGPRMQVGDGRVVTNFIVQALKGEALTIYGDGTQTRSFCYVDDLVNGILALMDQPKDYTGPVNLGNPQEIAMGELAEEIVRLTGSRSRVEYHPLPENDPRQRCPDITLARDTLGWEPVTDRRSGLERTIDYFRKVLEA